LACAVAITSLKVLVEEKMAENAAIQGAYLRKKLLALNHPNISVVRGKGLLNAIVIKHSNKEAAWDLCLKMKDNGLLAKPTHGDKIRFAPPLIITSEQIDECVGIIQKSLEIF
jgi:ornithine--oxo-acid transaminase